VTFNVPKIVAWVNIVIVGLIAGEADAYQPPPVTTVPRGQTATDD